MLSQTIRFRHNCEMVESEDQIRGPELIVVGGGTININSTDVYSINNQAWRLGPDFPVNINRYVKQ